MKSTTQILFAFVFSLALVFSACGGKGKINEKISDTLSGNAYDAVNANMESYTGVGNKSDGLTKAESFKPSPNEVSGMAHAECTNPASLQLDSDQATAFSSNQVKSKLTITKKGKLDFEINLKVEGEEIMHGDSIRIVVKANILTKAGVGIPTAGLTNSTFNIKPNTGSKDSVHIAKYDPQTNKTKNEKISMDKDGKWDHTFTATLLNKNSLPAGEYQLEFTVRIKAHAAAQTGTDGKRFKAKVDKVIGTIKLK